MKLRFLLPLLLFVAPLKAQIYDLPCPTGSSPQPQSMQTTVPSTGHVRANTCVDANGVMSFQGVASGTTGTLDPTQAPYNVKFDAISGADGTTINGSSLFSSTNQICSILDQGKLIVAVNQANGVYPYGIGLIVVNGCIGSAWLMSGNASISLAGNVIWGIGTSAGTTTTGLAKAYQDAFASNKILALPCGTVITSAPPFLGPSTLNAILQHPDINGCNSTGGTGFILHPNITNGIGAGPFFASFPAFGNPSPGSFFSSGLGGQNEIKNIFITSLRGALPFASAQYTLIFNFNAVHNIAVQEIGSNNNAAQITLVVNGAGENHITQCNWQNTTVNGLTNQAGWIGAQMGGQGVNQIVDTIIAFPGFGNAVICNNGSQCQATNDYIIQTDQGLSCSTGGCQWTITGSVINVSGGNGSAGSLFDNGTGAKFFVFGNPQISTQQANFPAMTVTAGSVFEVSANTFQSNTSGFIASGAGTILDRGGNSWTSTLAQFTGTYIPLGGGSAAFNSVTANTNFGANLGSQAVIAAANAVAPATYDIKIGFRQTTLGVGCGAGSNTVNGVLTWTSGGVVQSTGSGGVPALPTLTISANGLTGSSSVYSSVPIRIDRNTTVTFTTTSALVSAGCTTTPQYVADFSTI